MLEGFFQALKSSAHLIIPLAVVKILAVIMILWRKIKGLKWVYVGFFI